MVMDHSSKGNGVHPNPYSVIEMAPPRTAWIISRRLLPPWLASQLDVEWYTKMIWTDSLLQCGFFFAYSGRTENIGPLVTRSDLPWHETSVFWMKVCTCICTKLAECVGLRLVCIIIGNSQHISRNFRFTGLCARPLVARRSVIDAVLAWFCEVFLVSTVILLTCDVLVP